jgi:hypothetical protein
VWTLDGKLPADLLDREQLLKALEPHRSRDARIGEWIDRLEHQRGGIEDSGARGLDRSLGVLLDGVAMRGSLRTCPEALLLVDEIGALGSSARHLRSLVGRAREAGLSVVMAT